LRHRACRPAPVVVGKLRETPGSVAWQLSSLAADGGRGIRERPRRASTRFRARSKFANDARQGSRSVTPDAEVSATSVSQFVQLAGMSERLPSGSTMSSSRAPPRLIVLITGNARPSNGCRSRIIVADRKISRRWVVCDGFLRYHSPRQTPRLPRPASDGWCNSADDRQVAQSRSAGKRAPALGDQRNPARRRHFTNALERLPAPCAGRVVRGRGEAPHDGTMYIGAVC